MKFAILCLAASLAAVSTAIEPGMRSSADLQQSLHTQWSQEPTSDGAVLPQKFASAPEQLGDSSYYPQYPPHYPQYPQYPLHDPQPAEPGRELPYGQDGSIKVRNDGLFTILKFFVDYRLNGRKVRKESGDILTGLSRIITIPAQAQEITVTVQYVGLFGIVSDIHVRQFKYPVIRCYSSKDGRNVNQVGC